MLNVIFDFYNTTTKRIISSHLSFLNICPNVDLHSDIHQNIPLDIFKQKCHLFIKYWQQQKTVELLAIVAQLEQLAINDPQHNWLILEFLSNFVRNQTADIYQAAVNNSSVNAIGAEIQAILTLIGKIHRKKDSENEQLDLSHADLPKANLQQANLEWANLYHVNLAGANLCGANLAGAILSAANLSGANLAGANLSGAILSAANFSQANLRGSNLSQANLYLANLHQASLDHAILAGANLRASKFTKI